MDVSPFPERAFYRPSPASAAADEVPAMALRLRGVGKRYGTRNVLQALDLDLEAGQFVAIVGRSGCGKSTLLRLLAGLEDPDSGSLLRPAGAAARVRLMFQDARLLPWARTLDNVVLGRGRAARREAQQWLGEVGLADRQRDWPAALSGGQRQRVALARALAQHPQMLLLDEPLGALDALTRIEMQALIERLWLQRRFTAVLVTHDVQEAVALADRVLVLAAGRVAEDVRIDLPRPRRRGSAAFAACEARLLAPLLAGADGAGDGAAADTLPR